MALVLGIMLGVGGVGLGGYWFYDAYSSSQDRIAEEKAKLDETTDKVERIRSQQVQLDRWRRLSLQPDIVGARSEYNQFLRNLLTRTGMLEQSITAENSEFKSQVLHPTKPGKQPIYTGITFVVEARATLTTLVSFLKEFQRTTKMHRIKRIVIDPWELAEKSKTKIKNPPNLTVHLWIEALTILDAEVLQKRTKTPDRSVILFETLSGLLRKPAVGIATAGWAISRVGPIVTPINPPLLATRKYEDIALKNIFKGPQGWGSGVEPPETDPDGKPIIRTEEDFNQMKFRRFYQYTSEIGRRRGQTISVDVMLWDWTQPPQTGTQIVNTRLNNTIPLVKTRDLSTLIYGKVFKVTSQQIVFRVMLKVADTNSSKWWRYPNDDNFYRLHDDEFQALVKDKKVNEDDRSELYLVSDGEWEELKEKSRVQVSKDKKRFQFGGSVNWGDIVHQDSRVVIIKTLGWPLKAPEKATIAYDRLYPEGDQIYSIHPNHLAYLMKEDKDKAKFKGKKEEIDRIYVINTEYFNHLYKDKLIKTPGNGKIVFYHDLIHGDILHQNDIATVFRVDEKYCLFPGREFEVDGKITNVPKRMHEGYVELPIGGFVAEALMNPLSAKEVQELFAPATTPTFPANAAVVDN
jgi:hypothetical protein